MKSDDLIIMKFGGSSLATLPQRQAASDRIARAVSTGCRVVVVVSAIGRAGDPYATDTLMGLLSELPQAAGREIDALVACGEEISAALMAAQLQQSGIAAVSLRGFQAGIITDSVHQEAAIREIRPMHIHARLAAGEVVVVAGFQGVTADGSVTTLGRGGSDTTAMALGKALMAARIEICTDVDGVHTADPRVVTAARPVPRLTYDESAELAQKGAAILHPRAAELAREGQLPVAVCGAGEAATWLVPDTGRWEAGGAHAPRTTAVTSTAAIAQVAISGVHFAAEPRLLEQLFGDIARRGISLDMISILPERVAFTLVRERAAEAAAAAAQAGLSAAVNARCAKVTLIGGGIHGIPGIMHLVVGALARRGIAILQSADSNMIISVLVCREHEVEAVRALHAEFFE